MEALHNIFQPGSHCFNRTFQSWGRSGQRWDRAEAPTSNGC